MEVMDQSNGVLGLFWEFRSFHLIESQFDVYLRIVLNHRLIKLQVRSLATAGKFESFLVLELWLLVVSLSVKIHSVKGIF
jgi:hypothetical protein